MYANVARCQPRQRLAALDFWGGPVLLCRPRLRVIQRGCVQGRLGGDAVFGRRYNDLKYLCYESILPLTPQSASGIQIIMKIRRCEYCKRRLPVGMRIDAVFCGDACRINAHKQRKRDARKQRELSIITSHPPIAYPMSGDWEGIMMHMLFTYPGDELVLGYRLFKNGSIYPNPNNSLRVVKGELRNDLYYHWKPFEPPSVPARGEYKYQWWYRGDYAVSNFADPQCPTCFVTVADPQARFHRNRAGVEELTTPEWRRVVKQKLYPYRHLLKKDSPKS